MLALSEKDAKRIAGKGGYSKIAVSETDKKFEVFLLTHGCFGAKPCIRPERIDALLTDSDWLETACKKYRLPAKEIRKLKKTWTLGSPIFESDNLKAQLCFREMEKTLIGRMKRVFSPEKNYKMLPWIDVTSDKNSKPSNLYCVANTAAGKSTLLSKLLCTTDRSGNNWASSRKIVAFTLHRSDSSMEAARKCHRANWIDIDLEKIQGPIQLSAIPKGALCIFDDVLELDKSDPRRGFIYDLLNRIVTVGRHAVGKKGNSIRGLEACILTHYGSRRELGTIRNACRFWILFPGTSRHQAVHMLKSRLDFSRKQIQNLLGKAKDSRYVCFHNHHPQYVVSERHIEVFH